MASRIFWVLLAGVALFAGIMTQERGWHFGWAADSGIESAKEAAIEARIEQAIESSLEGTPVVLSEGRTVKVAPQTSREFREAVRRLVAAETELAMTQVGDTSDAAVQEARRRRDVARADVERLKAEIERQEQLSQPDRDLMRQQIQEEVRTSVRETIRTAIRG